MDKQILIPTQFSSIDEMHEKGFIFADELPAVEIEQRWVKEAEKRGLSIPRLADLAGLHRQSLYTAKTGTTQLSLESAFRICFVLGITMDEAFVLSKSTLYKACIKDSAYVYINSKTLRTLPESERRKLRGRPEYDLIKGLYHSFF